MYRRLLIGLCALVFGGFASGAYAATPHTVYLPLTIVGGAAAPDVSDVLQDDQAAVVALTNEFRAEQGCAPLTPVPELMRAAQLHSEDMVTNRYFSHTGLDGSTPGARMRAQGYIFRMAGENIAVGYETAEDVIQGWKDSPGHRDNMRNCAFTEIGVGVAFLADGTPYWTQNFGTR